MSAEVSQVFARCKAEGRVCFIPYITGGYPTPSTTVPALLAAERSGADIIEVGVPFSDPIADGGTIQAANQHALENGVTLDHCLAFIAEAREKGLRAPVILMGYYNIFLQYGENRLVEACAKAGVHGFIIVDLPPVEAVSFREVCDKCDLCLVPLVAPTTTDERLAVMAQQAKGYAYCVSLNGVTGARKELPEHLGAFLERVRAHFTVPLAVGFGLSTREHIKAVQLLADGAIMGSALVRALGAGSSPEESSKLLGDYIAKVTQDPQ